MRTVLVTGDRVWRHDVLRAPRAASTMECHANQPIFRSSPVGAWHLANLVDAACSGMAAPALRPDCPTAWSDPGEFHHSAHAFASWELFPAGGRSEARAWRIREFLGCHSATEPPAPEFPTPHAPPDLVMVDDADLGFRERPTHWHPSIIATDGPPIVLVAKERLGEGALWTALATDHGARTTVVTTLDALRRRDAAISTDLSWDRTLDDLQREVARASVAWWFRAIGRLVVLMPGVGVAWLLRGGSGYRIDRCVYHPVHQAGSWRDPRTGVTLTGTRLLAAAVVRHLLEPETYPATVAMSRALVAARACHAQGAGLLEEATCGAALGAFTTFPSMEVVRAAFSPQAGDRREDEFLATIPEGPAAGLPARAANAPRTLLIEGIGTEPGDVDVVAQRVVREGWERALSVAPRLQVGKFVTADREEIERLNEVRRLIGAYRNDARDVRPLSIAVFGPPGSGKSFAIKQLAGALFPEGRSDLEFNLSQFDPAGPDLMTAFHMVRDATIRGSMPLVFWDEFDSLDLGWLARFLAPMQDGAFREGGVEHRFGKAIFVFAGGTSPEFSRFDLTESEEGKRTPQQMRFHAVKGPDFVSRLRGYLDVKGPNPAGPDDQEFPIRRAILLRSMLQRLRPQLLDAASKAVSIRPGVLNAFLHVPQFRHGARSLESIVAMSSLEGASTFGPEALPSREMLHLHVDDADAFLRLAPEGAAPGLSPILLESLARGGFEGWRLEKLRQIATGEASGDQNADLVSWDALDEAGRRRNRDPVPRRWAFFRRRGYVIERFTDGDGAPRPGLAEHDREAYCAFEHQIWLRERWVRGWSRLPRRDPALRGHPDMCAFDDLEAAQQALNGGILDGMVAALEVGRWRIVKEA